MNSSFYPSSMTFYKVIVKENKIKPFANEIFDTFRQEKYSDPLLSYDGRSESFKTSLLVKKHIINNNIYKHAKIKLCQINEKYDHANSLKYCRSNFHTFLKIEHPIIEPLIIDPTYKDLFFVKRGRVEKWFSTYAEYLYRLPPVFIGTENNLKHLVEELQNLAELDEYHKDDLESIMPFHIDSNEINYVEELPGDAKLRY